MIDLALDVRLTQGDFVLEVRDRAAVEVLGLFGPSGAGKTSLLEAIAGLRRVEAGEIAVGGRTLFSSTGGVDLPARARRIGYVPQDSLLFPHLSVRANLMYGAPRGAVAAPGGVGLARLASVLEIDGLVDRPVTGLSGGERQRVAIGRALAAGPALLLLDEPLAAVDRQRRDRILPYLLRIRRELHVPLVYVTHDADELRQVADRVLVVEDGRVTAAGRPDEVLHVGASS
ncbi:MAG: ATP-binding cassette domain-containing protein [Vicinamibacterales bacterium]